MSDKAKKLLLIFSICLNVGFIVIAAYAFYQRPTPTHRYPHSNWLNAPGVFESVNLSRQQQEEIDQLVQLLRANILSVNKAVAPLKAELFSGMAGNTPISEERAQSIIKKMNVLQNRRGELIYQHLKALRQVLTEDQAQQVFRRFAEIQKKWSRKVKPML